MGKDGLPNWSLSLNCLFQVMKYQIFTLIGLLLVTSCKPQPNSHLPNGDSTVVRTNGVIKNQEAIAKEIVSIEYAFGDAMVQLNNTNAVVFVAEVESLADRLDKISKELDALGLFPAGLREATLKKLNDDGEALAQLIQSRKASGSLKPGSLQPEVAKITDPAVDKYFSAMAPVMRKAGLLIEAKREASGINTNGQGTNKP